MRDNNIHLKFNTRDVGKITNNINIQAPRRYRKRISKSKYSSLTGDTGDSGDSGPFQHLYQSPSQIPFGQVRGTNPLVDIEGQNIRRIADEERQHIQKMRQQYFNQPASVRHMATQTESGNVVAQQPQEFTGEYQELPESVQNVDTMEAIAPTLEGEYEEEMMPAEEEEPPSREGVPIQIIGAKGPTAKTMGKLEPNLPPNFLKSKAQGKYGTTETGRPRNKLSKPDRDRLTREGTINYYDNPETVVEATPVESPQFETVGNITKFTQK